jgi:hypothetical protein
VLDAQTGLVGRVITTRYDAAQTGNLTRRALKGVRRAVRSQTAQFFPTGAFTRHDHILVGAPFNAHRIGEAFGAATNQQRRFAFEDATRQ